MSTFLPKGAAFCCAAIVATTAGASSVDQPPIESVLAQHGLAHGTLVTLPVNPVPGHAYLAPLVAEQTVGILELEPFSVRSDSFRLIEAGANGLQEIDPGPVRTYRGRLAGAVDASVSGAAVEGGLEAIIIFDDGRRLAIEPVGGTAARPGLHVVYDPAEIISGDHACGVSGDAMRISPKAGPAHSGRDELHGHDGAVEGGALQIAELACDADYEYFLDYGSTAAVGARIESVINTMNQQYESEVGISHELTTIIVRSTSNDPYSSSNAETLLNQFRNHWQSSQGSVPRDVAQLFTGKEIDGGTIGIAWIGAVCTSFGYGMVQSDFNNNFASATDLSAHELGHNWNADHCSCTSFTMNPFIVSANTFSPTFTRGDIASFRNNRTCLEDGGGNPPPPPSGDLDITSATVFVGSVAGGTVGSLINSDNDRVLLDSERVSNSRDRTDLRVIYNGASNSGSLTVAVELSVSTTIRTQIFIRNQSNNSWKRLARFNGPSNDTLYTFTNLSAGTYVNGSGEVEVRVYSNRRNRPHQMRIDRMTVTSN
ncbi:MAG: M12 family metallo-peptidase [Phycisphaerales bacterium]